MTVLKAVIGVFILLFILIITGCVTDDVLRKESSDPFVAIKANPEKPLAKPNLTMHMAAIYDIALDYQEQYLISISDDNTTKVWDIDKGKLLHTLYIPMTKLSAIASHPKKNIIALAGYSHFQKESKKENFDIYLIDFINKKVVSHLKNLPEAIQSLAFSSDGTYLAVGLAKDQGLKIYQTKQGQLIAEDHAYTSDCHQLVFTQDNQLITAALDGHIRLYNSSFKLQKILETSAVPRRVALHPDQKILAVGYDDLGQIELRQLPDLQITTSIQLPNIIQAIHKITWSQSGETLYASGNNPIVLYWNTTDFNQYKILPHIDKSIQSIQTLNNQDIIIAGNSPYLAALNHQQMLWEKKPNILNLSDLAVSADGLEIQLSDDIQNPLVFSLVKRTLNNTISNDLNPPITDTLAIPWQSLPQFQNIDTKPKFAIHPNGDYFLLAEESNLYYFNKAAKLQWQQMTDSNITGLNITADGQLAVIALADGTIIWYSLIAGKKQMTLLIEKDTLEWVVWTAEGYYITSADGDRLMGWQVNQSRDQLAHFFQAGQLRKEFYQPAVFENISQDQRDIQHNQKILAQNTPPIIEILSPSSHTVFSKNKIQIAYQVSNLNQPLENIKVLLDGRPSRGLARVQADINTIEIDLPKRDVSVALIAENSLGASLPASIDLVYFDKNKTDKKPQLYILAIGVSDYDQNSLDLKYADQDAKDFVERWQLQEGKLYEKITVNLLTNIDKKSVLSGLAWLKANVTQGDMAMLFFAGHGVNDILKQYYFLASDANPQALENSAVTYLAIKNTLNQLPGKVITFIDTCYAGNLLGSNQIMDINGLVADLKAAENGIIVFASSTGEQLAQENDAWQNGAFTEALLEGLQGKAAYSGDGRITLTMLELYLSERVRELTRGAQTPTATRPSTITDFTIAIVDK